MRTCCPNCATVFRITAEQLRVRLGMVRCGQCQAVFNAFDSLVEAEPPVVAGGVSPPQSAPAAVAPSHFSPPDSPVPEPSDRREPGAMRLDPIDAVLAAEETPEESTRAAREAGLVAARELAETPGYDRWSAGAVEAGSGSGFFVDTPKRPRWPFVLAFLILSLTLAAQAAYYFRSDLAANFPDLAGIYQALNISLPLPRQVDLVAIEVSDLQADKARGLLVLQSTLKNRARFDQEWPSLELTLTDTNDEVVSRRVLNAADYLPSKVDSRAFAGSTEVGIRLWLESKQPAAGYRLFLFYP